MDKPISEVETLEKHNFCCGGDYCDSDHNKDDREYVSELFCNELKHLPITVASSGRVAVDQLYIDNLIAKYSPTKESEVQNETK